MVSPTAVSQIATAGHGFCTDPSSARSALNPHGPVDRGAAPIWAHTVPPARVIPECHADRTPPHVPPLRDSRRLRLGANAPGTVLR